MKLFIWTVTALEQVEQMIRKFFLRFAAMTIVMRPLLVALTLRLGSGFVQNSHGTRERRRVAVHASEDVAVVLLAGGVGSRMKADRPKQFLELRGKPVLEHSLELFLGLDGVSRVVLVLDEAYRSSFSGYDVTFADPGAERQDSVKNGVAACPEDAALICIHDAARPLVTPREIYEVIKDAREHGAAVLGVPMKATVKEGVDGFVTKTLDRSRLWEVQTPQVIRPDLLQRGFSKVDDEQLQVTDDVSIVEHLGEPVKLTLGEYTNLKLTTPDDMIIAGNILDQRAASA